MPGPWPGVLDGLLHAEAGLARGPGRDHVSQGLLQRRLGVVVRLLAHRVDLDQIGLPLCLKTGGLQLGFGTRKARPGAIVGGLVAGRIDLVEQLSGLDLAALDELARLDDAYDLRADLRDQVRHGTPR